MTPALLVALMLGQADGGLRPVDPNAPLPPGHPPVGGGMAGPTGAAMPGSPGSPGSMAGPVDPNAPLPPNHPPMNAGAQGTPASGPRAGPVDPNAPLPPNHPAIGAQGGIRVPPSAKVPPNAFEVVKQFDKDPKLLKEDRSFDVALSLGKLFYAVGRWKEAVELFKQSAAKAEPARSVYLANKKKAGSLPTAASVGCTPGGDATFATLLASAQAKVRASDAAAAAACAGAALEPTREADVMMGNAQFLLHDAAAAAATFGRALELFEDNADARYGRAMVLVDSKGDDVKGLKAAKSDLERFIKDFPTSPKLSSCRAQLAQVDAAIAAGGMTALAKKRAAEAPKAPPPPVDPAALPAISDQAMAVAQNVVRDDKTEARITKMVEMGEGFLVESKFQEALESYKAAMMMGGSGNGRLQAGMAWSLVGLGKPTADRIWMVAVTSDPGAVEKLGDTLKSKGNASSAKAVWQKLKESSPQYAAKAKLDDKLR